MKHLPLMMKLIGLVALPLVTTGCWSSVEINQRAVIIAAALDKAETDGKIALSIQVANPNEVEKGGDHSVLLYSKIGYTIFEAGRYLQEQISRKPFWGQTQLIIVGEERARDGICELLDFNDRNFEPNRRAFLLVARGTTGRQALQAGYGFGAIPATTLLGLVQRARDSGRVPITNLNEMLNALDAPGRSVTAPYLEFDPPSPARPEMVDQNQRVLLKGVAVFQHDKLVGYLLETESRGLSWAINKVRNTVVVVPGIDNPTDKIALRVVKAQAKIEPSIKESHPSFTIKVTVQAHVTEVMAHTLDVTKMQVLDTLNSYLATAIRNEISSAVTRAKALHADIFGFGTLFQSAYQTEWKKIAKNWDNVEFPKADVQIEVKSQIVHSGFLLKPRMQYH